MKNFEAVIFDMDGVIFDSERAVLECWKELADKYGLKNLEKPFLACTGTTKEKTREIMMEFYGEDFHYDEFAREASKLFHEKYDGGKLPVKKGAKDILEFLKGQKVKIALASSTRRESVINQLRAAGLLDYFDELVTGDMVTRSKPDPEIFLMACEKVGVKPEKAYAIEDSYNGIRSAFGGKLMPIMVPDLLPADEEMDNKAVVVLQDLCKVIDYLRN